MTSRYDTRIRPTGADVSRPGSQPTGPPVAASRPDGEVARSARAEARDRLIRRRVGIAWGLLVLDTIGTGSLLHLPSAAGKLLTQGALPLAIVVALSVNRRVVVRPNIFLCLVSLLVIETVVTTLTPQYFGTVYRTFRFAEFVVALWLLSPWWARRDMLLVRCHLRALAVVLGSVILGIFVAPGRALGGGRLSGEIWYIPPPQVAHYAAVTFGMVVVLWLCGRVHDRPALLIVCATGFMLLLTHTRTALVGMVAGILVAGLSLVAARARARKLFASVGAVAAVAIMTASGFITTWLARGEGTQELTNLTGRTLVWGPLLAYPRDKFQEIFGFGLSNDSFNGLSIDSNWLASYQEQGLFGVAVCAAILIFLLVTAYFTPRGVQRALALFLVTYCLVASFTEVGFTNPTPYLLDLTVAASLIGSSGPGRRLA